MKILSLFQVGLLRIGGCDGPGVGVGQGKKPQVIPQSPRSAGFGPTKGPPTPPLHVARSCARVPTPASDLPPPTSIYRLIACPLTCQKQLISCSFRRPTLER